MYGWHAVYCVVKTCQGEKGGGVYFLLGDTIPWYGFKQVETWFSKESKTEQKLGLFQEILKQTFQRDDAERKTVLRLYIDRLVNKEWTDNTTEQIKY